MTPEALCEMQLAEETRRLTLKGRAAACLQVAAPALLAYRPGLCRRRAVGTLGLARILDASTTLYADMDHFVAFLSCFVNDLDEPEEVWQRKGRRT